jgi:hypothetical protein
MGWRRFAAVALGAVLLGAPPWADEEYVPKDAEREEYKPPQWQGWGLRVGVGDDPDQVIAGVQFDFGDVARRVYLEPNVELGIGSDHTILTVSGALHYRFQKQRSFRPYAGGAITLGLDYHDPPDRDSDTDFAIALKAIGGTTWILKSRREFFLELALVVGDLHDVQLMAGWRF